MTNTELLKQKIAESGLRFDYIAKSVGITRQSLSMKVGNKRSFDQYEIQSICDVLNITKLEEKEAIFFAH